MKALVRAVVPKSLYSAASKLKYLLRGAPQPAGIFVTVDPMVLGLYDLKTQTVIPKHGAFPQPTNLDIATKGAAQHSQRLSKRSLDTSWYKLALRSLQPGSGYLSRPPVGLPHIAGKYRTDIDGLRAFAVLSVMLYHAFPYVVRGGYVGVDIFFVISGFLISSILFSELTEHRFSFAAFYGRRIRRIFPALAVCLTAVLAYGFICLMPSELAQLGKHVFFGAGFLSNIVLWSEAGYFDTAATLKPLLHLWSLGIEEQFYIVWPVLLWVAVQTKIRTSWLLIMLFVSSLAINIALSGTNISSDFYLPFSRFWELLAGAGLALRGQLVLAPNVRSLISCAGLIALLMSTALFSPGLQFPGWPALLPVSGAAAVILAGPEAVANRTVLSNRVVVAIGLISYPLYLWHWPLLSYAYVIRLGKTPTPLMAGALLACTFLLAFATYRWVEYPIRYSADRRRRTLFIAMCVALLGLCGLTVWAKAGFPERFPELPGIDVRKIGRAKLDAAWNVTEGMDVSDLGHIWVAQLGRGERKVALGGDSVLFHYGPRVQQLADEGRLRANTYFVVGASCPPVPNVIQQGKNAKCIDLPDILIDLVRREKVQSVVLGGFWYGYGYSQSIERVDAFYADLEEYVRVLQGMGAKVYLVLGVAKDPHFNPAEMVKRSMTGFRIAPDVNAPIPISSLQAPVAAANAKLRSISEHTGALLLDPLPDICRNGEGCSPFFGEGEPKFSDGLHLRPAFVRQNVRFLDPLLTGE